MKKLFALMFVFMFMISFTSAFDFDNVKEVDYKELSLNYPKITITNSLLKIFPLSKITDIALTKHTSKCLNGICNSEQTFFNYKEISPVEDIRFINREGKELTDIEYNLYTYETETYYEDELDLEKSSIICGEDTLIANGTKKGECDYNEVYSPIEKTRQTKIDYNFGDEYAGTRIIGIDANIKDYDYVDYVFKSANIWTEELAPWNPADCQATGGTITIDGEYCVHTFLTDDNFDASKEITNATILVVSGGGAGGGAANLGGGGGAGGLNYSIGYTISSGITSVAVGIGGSANIDASGDNGGNSTFDTITTQGGGGGAEGQGAGSALDGNNGGSGGGAGQGNAGAGSGGTGIAGQGFDGGNAGGLASLSCGGGGGGSNETGSNCVETNLGGRGGNGTQYDINGTNVYYAGGGGGGGITSVGIGGLGGGGQGGLNLGSVGMTAGTDGLGGGGGGAGDNSPASGADGGNGTVIIRYLIDAPGVTISQSYPINYFNTSNSILDVSCNFTSNLQNITSVKLDIYNSSDYLSYTNTESGLIETSYNKTWATSSLGDSVYNWSCFGFGNLGNNGSTSNRTFTIDATAPIINLIEPRSQVNYHKIGNNLTINWTVTDTHLESCWFTYNNTNTSQICAANNYSFIPVDGKQNLTFYANDSLGNENFNFTSWTYKILEINQSYNNLTTEGNAETFRATVNLLSGLSISSANLIYNDTLHSGTNTISGDNNILQVSDLIIPNIIPSEVNNSFYWNLSLSDDSVVKLESYNQTVKSISLDNCSANANKIFNFTIYDEELLTKLTNTTLDVAVNIYSSDKVTLITSLSSNYSTNPTQICLNVNLTSSSNYVLDTIVNYRKTGYSSEYYNIVGSNFNLTNSFKDISLYDLNSSDSTDFQLTFRDSSSILAPNILVKVYRQYIASNDFKIVEVPITDSNGQTILHLVRNDAVYNFIMQDAQGNIVSTFNKIIAFCQDFTIGSCEIILNAEGEIESFYNYLNEVGISYTTTYSNVTELLSFNFVSVDGTPKKVGIDVTRGGSFGNRSVCSETLTSASGVITCNASSVAATDMYLYLDIIVDDNLVASDITNLEAESFNWGVNGSLFAFLLILALMLMFSEDKQLLIVGILFGWIISVSMGFISGKIVGVGAASLWLVVTGIIIIWKLRKEEFG